MVVDRLDHLVLTVANIEATCDFYSRVLGMEVVKFSGRVALKFGKQKFNLHKAGQEISPYANKPTPGSADICLVVTPSIEQVLDELHAAEVSIEFGPVERTGANGTVRSLYLRDPDQNLIELSNYI